MINRRGGPNGSSPFATSRLKDARGELAGSRGSDCEVALRASVKSSTLRAKNPTWSRELASGWTPARKIEPKLGLNPTNQRTDIGSESHLNHFDITIGIHAVLPQQLHKKRCTRRWHQAGNHVWPFKSLTLLKETSGVVTIQTAAPFTTFAMMFTGAPFAAAIAVHSGPCREERGAGQDELNGDVSDAVPRA